MVVSLKVVSAVLLTMWFVCKVISILLSTHLAAIIKYDLQMFVSFQVMIHVMITT